MCIFVYKEFNIVALKHSYSEHTIPYDTKMHNVH